MILNGVEGYNRRLIALEGRERTAIVASGLSTTLAIFKLLDEFAARSTKWNARICHIDLTDGGTLTLAKMAYEVLSWHFSLEDLVVAALDVGSKARCPKEGVRLATGSSKKVEYYLGKPFYDPHLDIDLVECSCNEEVIQRLKSNKNTQTLGNDVRRWRDNESTCLRRLPAVMAYAGCSTGFMKLGGKGKKPTKSYLDEGQLDEFIRVFKEKATELGKDVDEEPEEIKLNDPVDPTLKPRAEDEAAEAGSVRYGSRLLHLDLFDGSEPFPIVLENAVIVVARVAMRLDPNNENLGTPYLENLYIGNSDGRVLAIFEAQLMGWPARRPRGVIRYGGKQSTPDEMRHALLRYLGCNNFVVGFNIGWTLAALNLVLPGHRVVDIGTENSFQFLCQQMAELNRDFRNMFVNDMANSYDRRIPATLFGNGLDLYPDELVDPIRELYYTSAIWNVLANRVKGHRERLDVDKIKKIVPVGAGTTPTVEEEELLCNNVSLIRCTVDNVHPGFKCTPAEVLEILDVSPIQNFEWKGEHQEFLNQCVEFMRLWLTSSAWNEWNNFSWSDSYGDWSQRRKFAVNLSIPSRVVNNRVSLMVDCINHHTGTSIKQLREYSKRHFAYNPMKSYVGQRLFTIWMDFAPRHDLPDEDQPKPTEDPLALPENVLDTTAAAPSASTSSATSGAASSSAATATETRSSAQTPQADESATHPTSQPPKPHQPVSLAPSNLIAQFEVRRRVVVKPTSTKTPAKPTSTVAKTVGTSTVTTPATSVFAMDVTESSLRSTSAASDTTSLPGSPARSTRSNTRAATPVPSPSKATATAKAASTSGRTPPVTSREGVTTRSQLGQASPAKSAGASTTSHALEPDD